MTGVPRLKVVLADYGAGNLRSVTSAFERAGAAAAITTDPVTVRDAPLAVIAAWVETLREGDVDQ